MKFFVDTADIKQIEELIPTGFVDGITTNPCFAGPELRTLYVTLGSTGRLIAFDNWPTQGLKLAFQKGINT